MTMTDAELAEIRARVEKPWTPPAQTYKDSIALLDELATAREENERLRRDVVRLESAVRDVVAQRVGVDNPRTGRYLEDLNFALLEHLRSALNETTTTDWSKSYALHSATEDADDRTT